MHLLLVCHHHLRLWVFFIDRMLMLCHFLPTAMVEHFYLSIGDGFYITYKYYTAEYNGNLLHWSMIMQHVYVLTAHAASVA